MVRSRATNVEQYLRELPPERRREIEAVRAVVRANLPPGYIESIEYGMIGYAVPLARFPDTYNGQPLTCASLAAQKHHNALYLTCAYTDPKQEKALRDAAAKEGKKLDMGKSCIRFRRAEDLPLKAIGRAVASTPVTRLIAEHEAAHGAKRDPAKRVSPTAGARAKPASGATGKAPRARRTTSAAGKAQPAAKRGATKNAQPASKRVATKRASARSKPLPTSARKVVPAKRARRATLVGARSAPARTRGAWAAAVQRARSRRPY